AEAQQGPASPPRVMCGDRGLEAVVQARTANMGRKAGVRGQKATGNVAVREGYRLAAKIEIEIFTPDRPVRREGVFDAATDGPAHRDTRGRASRAVDREPRSIAAERR